MMMGISNIEQGISNDEVNIKVYFFVTWRFLVEYWMFNKPHPFFFSKNLNNLTLNLIYLLKVVVFRNF
jgi:hypothetical protein